MLKTAFRFGLIVLGLLVLFQLSNASVFVPTISFDVIISFGAIIMVGLGVYLGSRMRKTPQEKVELDTKKIAKLGLSERELEVLNLIAKGYSNQEIGEHLYLSENTIKTHVSNLFMKLHVKRRTQAVTKAREWGVIA